MKNIALSLLAPVVAVLAACQAAPARHAMLDDARAAVARLRSDTNVVRLAPAQLEDAETALRRAETAWDSGSDETDTRHLAYLARQRASIAENIAAARVADDRTRQAIAARDRLASERAMLAARAAQQQANAQVAAARQTAQQDAALDVALQRQLTLLQARDTDRGIVVSLQDPLFYPGRDTLRGRGERTAARLAEIMREHPGRRVMLAGLGSDVSGTSTSQDLAQRRAHVVREALIARGVSPDRIDVPGSQELRGYTGAWPSMGPVSNRGVDVLFSDAQGMFAPR